VVSYTDEAMGCRKQGLERQARLPLQSPYRITIPIFLCYAVTCAFLFRTVLNGNALLYGTDTVTHDYLVELYGWETVRGEGIVPLWLPHLFGGIPFLGSFAFCPFYPTKILCDFIRFPLAFNLQYCVNAFLAACFMYFFCRAMGLARSFAFFGGLMFLLSGHLITLVYPGHLQKFQAIVWMPAVLGFLKKGMDRHRVGDFALAGVALGMQLLASHTQIAFYTILMGLIFCIWLATDKIASRAWAKELGFAGAGVVVMAIVAVAWSGVQMLPGYEMARASNRAGGVSFADAAQSSYPPWEMIETLLPRFTGDSVVDTSRPYWGAWGERLVSDYAGMGVWILAACALVMSRRRERFLFAGLFCVAALLAMGRYSPLFWIAYHWLPGFNRFRSPAAIMVVMCISLVYLSAVGSEEVFSKGTSFKRRKGLLLTCLALATASLLFLLLIWAVVEPHFEQGAKAISSMGTQVFYQRGLDVLASAKHSLAFACVAFTLLALYQWLSGAEAKARAASLSRAVVIGVFILACSLDLYSNDRHFIKAMNIEPFHRYLYHTWSDDYLAGKEPPIRMLDLGNLLKNRMIVRRISTLHGYHPVAYQKYFDLVGALGFTSPAFSQIFFLRFLIAPEGNVIDNYYRPVITREHQTLYEYSPSVTQSVSEGTGSDGALTYAYFPAKIRHLETEKQILAMMSESSYRPYETSYALGTPKEVDNTLAHEASQSHVVAYSDNRVEIETHCPGPSWCVTADYAVPGWQAWLDGSDQLPIETGNYFFRMVRVPSGAHRVVFTYRPFSFRLGLYLTCLALVGGAAFAIGTWRRSRTIPVQHSERSGVVKAKHDGERA
jgi:hypothetical protein